MKPVKKRILFVLATLAPTLLFAANKEEVRLRGFAEHQNNQTQFEDARSRGEKAYLEQQEQWELARERTAEEYTKQKKSRSMEDDGPEAKADEAQKKEWADQLEKERRDYVELKAQNKSEVVRGKNGIPTEAEELNLADNRPRYDYKKRAYFGAPGKYKAGSSRGSGGSSGGGSWGGGSTPSFPNPPPFEDFGPSDGGYVPAPNMPDDFGDVPPPPPPPPPPPFGDEPFGSDMTSPIPPPTFDDGGDF